MWYVIQVKALHEIEIAQKCKRDVIKDGEDVFVFKSERFIRNGRSWKVESSPIFQKYLFVETDEVDDFRTRLRRLKLMTKFIGSGDEIVPIHADEEKWLKLLGGEDHIIRVSEAEYVGKNIVVTSGALEGLEGAIKWIDKRQKTVGIAVTLMGQVQTIKVGMEFVDPPKMVETGS